MSTDLVVSTKNELMSALGDKSSQYLSYMKLWFREKFTKEEFDMECRKLVSPSIVHLHNQFFIAILNKIGAISSVPHYQTTTTVQNHIQTSSGNNSSSHPSISVNSKRRRKPSRLLSGWASYKSADLKSNISLDDSSETIHQNGNIAPQQYAAQEFFLPDPGLIMGRLNVAAWEIGLVTAEDSAAEIIVQAVQNLLKNILSAIILKRKHTRYTADGQYYYDVGHEIRDPYLRTTVSKQKIDDEPIDINKVISSINTAQRRKGFDENIFTTNCEDMEVVQRKRITLLDVYRTLLDKNVIPSHSVYALNIERISNMLN